MSGCILHLSSLHSPVFLLNSCLDLFSAPHLCEDPLSRSYGVSLPSSLTMNLSTPQYILHDHVCPFAVRVPQQLLSGFSREYDYPRYCPPPRRKAYFQVRLGIRICLYPSAPTPFNGPFRRSAAVPRLRHHIACCGSYGMLTVSAIALAVRLKLRTRLTPG